MIVFDQDKDAANIAKHGVSLALAEDMDLALAVIVPDDRRDYGETRMNAFGSIDGVLYALTFMIRGDDIRAISLRRCRAKEVQRWKARDEQAT